MTSEDPRRKIIDEAMDAIENGWHKESYVGPTGVRRYIEESSRALPAAVELIEELTAEVADLRAGQANDDRDHRASVATIATQAKEVEKLRKYITATAPSKSEAKRVISMCAARLDTSPETR